MHKATPSKQSLLLFSLLCFIPNVHAGQKQTIGWLEHVTVGRQQLSFEAKIDTGADTSSLNAKILRKFTVHGEDWIMFELANEHGQSVKLQRKIERHVKIKRKLMLPIKRPVILLGICLGDIYRKLEVNLAKRKNFKYSMLIGRNYLRDHYLVDSAKTYTTQPTCQIGTSGQ